MFEESKLYHNVMRHSNSATECRELEISQELTLLDTWQIVKGRRRTVLLSTVVAIGIALCVGLFSTRRYESKGEIQIQKDSTDALGLDSMIGGNTVTVSDALDANVTLQTEAKIMESQTLALMVIDHLQIANEPDFQSHFSPIGWVLGFITPSGPSDPAGKPLGDSPKRRDRLFSVFKKNTKVAPISGTRLIQISYTSTNPRLAAAIVNQMIEGLVDYNFQTRYAATSQTSDWLGKQLSELRANSDDLQKQVADLQRSSGAFTFGREDLAGKGTIYSPVLDQLQQSTANLTQAESNRIVRGAIYEAAKSGNAESIATLVTSGTAGSGSAAVGQSLALLQSFRAQEATQKAQISELSAKFGPGYPRLEEMQANLSSVQKSIGQEQERLEEQAKSDYAVAQQIEDRTRTAFELQKKNAEALNDKTIQYELLRQEADQSRELYSKLQSKLKEAGVLEGLHSSNITVVEPGRIPSRPSSPNVIVLLLAALFGGPIIGLGFVFGAEIMDGKVRTSRSVADRFGADFLGSLPYHSKQPTMSVSAGLSSFAGSIVTLTRPQSVFSEALRSVRTALLASAGGAASYVLLITSSTQQEGKSTIAANLAVQLAQQGKRVLLIDTDLRSKTRRIFDQPTSVNCLSIVLQHDLDLPSIFSHAIPEVPGLSVIPAGPLPTHPSELLGSNRMRQLLSHFREVFDFILLDGAALLPVTDSLVVASLADEVLLVARSGVTESSDLGRSYRLLQLRAPQTAIGVVVNGIKDGLAHDYCDDSAGMGATNHQRGLLLNV
jgi:polysaccharide biosynthesis transport protein